MSRSAVDDDELSPKAARFIDALRALCREHGVILAVSDYDALQVWPLEERDFAEPIHHNGIHDRLSGRA